MSHIIGKCMVLMYLLVCATPPYAHRMNTFPVRS